MSFMNQIFNIQFIINYCWGKIIIWSKLVQLLSKWES